MTDLSTTGPTHDGGEIAESAGTSLNDLIAQRYSRRDWLRGGSAAVMAVAGSSLLAACGKDSNNGGGGTGDAPPTVTATPSLSTTATGTPVTITATATDNGTISATSWTQVSGPVVTLSATTGLTTSFIAPTVSSTTIIVIRFTANDNSGNISTTDANVTVTPATLAFTAVAKNKLDVVTVPTGYTVSVLYRTGDPIATGGTAYANNGTDTGFDARAGDHHDAIRWFGLQPTGTVRDDLASTRGVMLINHEGVTQAYLHPAGPTSVAGVRPEAEALKEIEAHGLSLVETSRTGTTWAYVQGSAYNRRITPNTPVAFNGPVRGNALLQTAFSSAGTDGRGTISNCGADYTAWGTGLVAERGWAAYFRRPTAADNARRSAKEIASLTRYGVVDGTGQYGWASVVPADGANTSYRRWDAQATGASATADYRNEPNQFGWVVEVDPYDVTKAPRKRTALGRLAHANATPGPFIATRKPAIYMGDEGNGEYLYKFVSNTAWASADAGNADRLSIGDKYLDTGTLYVATFAADGTGTWVPLTLGTGNVTTTNATYAFADQADVLANARIAADVSSATPMDRPEWVAVHPITGQIFLALNGNPSRTNANTSPTNPRSYQDPPSAAFGNRNGHIIRIAETNASTEATTFNWDIYAFGAGADLSAANINVSALDATNDFSGPDALAFARPANPSGQNLAVMWIQTDDTAYQDVTNNQMLAAMPGAVGDNGTTDTIKTLTNSDAGGGTTTQATRVGKAPGALLKRFLVGPVEAEVTGVDSTPDGRALFVSIQHPGAAGTAAAPTSNWPASQAGAAAGVRPRSATIVITRNDGGVVGL